jgi:penicillin amidase
VQLGHNRNVHWAATTGFADCMDLYSVSQTGDTINAGGKQVAITVRNEEIKVKGGNAVTVLKVSDVDGYGVLLGDALPFPEGWSSTPAATCWSTGPAFAPPTRPPRSSA